MHYRSAIPVLVGCLFATNVLAADLMQTYMEALANDPQYASARASLMAGQEKKHTGTGKNCCQIFPHQVVMDETGSKD